MFLHNIQAVYTYGLIKILWVVCHKVCMAAFKNVETKRIITRPKHGALTSSGFSGVVTLFQDITFKIPYKS